jgi:hypothetical protein
MRRFLKEEKGDSMMLLLFIIPLFVMIAIVVLAVSTVYTSESHVRGLLERSVSVSVDASQNNYGVRDLAFTVTPDQVRLIIEQRLLNAGFSDNGDNSYSYGDKYKITEMTITTDGDELKINADLRVDMPWRVTNSFNVVNLAIDVQSHILFY